MAQTMTINFASSKKSYYYYRFPNKINNFIIIAYEDGQSIFGKSTDQKPSWVN